MPSVSENTFVLHQQTRQNILALLDAHTTEQLNRIPEGFNNNLVWNAGHVIATQELLVFALGGHRTPSGRDFIDRYRKGSRPEGPADTEELAYIRAELLEGNRRLKEAVGDLDWSEYQAYPTSYGVTLSTVAEAIEFNNMHEAMHLGTMLALRKVL
ncbi:DinB family protein [Lewinella sp. JB7]|uniref:DinB family protein n=1 Tax=Lewinella sp. JB7 TaxID=2962887 RepID=UPI0020CA1593|nr:DinB family protein [Lewinella sp. JB7]MCP9237814.1 DinB family protein [Lewinella sp. JB7]